jgi:hypothetical protein
VSAPIGNLKKLAKAMREVPKVLAQRVAGKVAPDLTAKARASFAAGENVYGDARPAGVNGSPLTLERTGATKASIRFVSVGTIVRASLGTKYARYLVGKYKILPASGSPMPAKWATDTGRIVEAEIARVLP